MLANILIVSGVAIILLVAIRSLIQSRKSGKGGCAGGCAGCSAYQPDGDDCSASSHKI